MSSLGIVPGTRIGRYEIVELIGQGGFAQVFLAKDPDLDRRVALKIVRYHGRRHHADPVRNEARILADLEHPSILTVFDTGLFRDEIFMVCEYLPGSLERELRQASPALSAERVVEAVTPIADALDFVHRRGYLHRNVKPRVILLDASGKPRLSGFEVAVQRETLDTATVAGTPLYMAPEQFYGQNSDLGPPTDVWGLGTTMYHLLTGRLPFESGSISEILRGKYTHPVLPREINASVPQAIEDICLKCLRKEPMKRYSTAELLAADLREWRRGVAPPRQQRVFISHSAKDRDFVEREIIALLESKGIATWYSKVDIQTAVEWERSILYGLQSTDWFLLVMSSRSSLSEWVKDELHWAIDNRFEHIIPVLIDDCDPRQFHIRMARLQQVDFRTDLASARQRLLCIFQPDRAA